MLQIENLPIYKLCDFVVIGETYRVSEKAWKKSNKYVRAMIDSSVCFVKTTELFRKTTGNINGASLIVNRYNDDMNLVTVMNRDGEVVYRFIDFNKYVK